MLRICKVWLALSRWAVDLSGLCPCKRDSHFSEVPTLFSDGQHGALDLSCSVFYELSWMVVAWGTCQIRGSQAMPKQQNLNVSPAPWARMFRHIFVYCCNYSLFFGVLRWLGPELQERSGQGLGWTSGRHFPGWSKLCVASLFTPET